jgi:hypothetical protein
LEIWKALHLVCSGMQSAFPRGTECRTLADHSLTLHESPHLGGLPVFGQHTVGDPHDVSGDPVPWAPHLIPHPPHLFGVPSVARGG